MHRLLLLILTGALLCGAALAQDQPQPSTTNPETTPAQSAPDNPSTPTQAPIPSAPEQNAAQPGNAPGMASDAQTPRIAPGSVIPVELTKTVDAKKAKSGDEVIAKVTMDLKSTGGQIIVPKDTQVIGHITEAQARSKEQKSSEVGIAFDHAVMKDGGQVPLPMSIQAIIAPPKSSANNAEGATAPGEQASPSASPNAGAGRSPGMGGSSQQSPNAPSAMPSGDNPSSQQQGSQPKSNGGIPPITGKTAGVIGISNITLAPAANATQGSVVSSEKNNVKLEDGTFMLLRVN
jgi:hypothetical protein